MSVMELDGSTAILYTSAESTPASDFGHGDLLASHGGIDDSFVKEQSRDVTLDIPHSTLTIPRARYSGYVPSRSQGEPVHEMVALSAMMALRDQTAFDTEDFIEFDLNDFCIYVNSANYPGELRSLHNLATKSAHDSFCFDGTLSIGHLHFFVRRVKFSMLPIGNYGRSNPTVGDEIWIQSAVNAKREVYYRLKKPAFEYARFHEPFRWAADLAKHVVDFCGSRVDRGRQVAISDFRAAFARWLQKTHGQAPSFQEWYSRHDSHDFRTSVVANVEFIYKEMFGVLGARKTGSLQLFRETRDFCWYKPSCAPGPEGQIPPTIVTPYIKDCFGHTKFGHLLKLAGPHAEAEQVRQGDTSPDSGETVPYPPTTTPLTREVIQRISPGDVISTLRDGESTGTKWKRESAVGVADDDRWFGLVQKVHESKRGHRSFDVVWLYRPVDTPCGRMKYPWPKELFLSDHCSCEEGRGARVDEDEVLNLPPVHWHGRHDDCHGEFFVRQTYLVEQRRWVGLEESQKRCNHRPPKADFRVGDTVLAVLQSNEERAEPFEVREVFREGGIAFVRLRQLLRKHEIDSAAKPNELVYSDHHCHEVVSEAQSVTVLGKCLVRFFRPGESIPPPYNRSGTANVFFITHKLVYSQDADEEECIPFEDESQFPTSLRQGFDPNRSTLPKLRGLDLFCGSGNFGRGLEEGGAIEMRWANDLWDRAIHTYMANAPDPGATHPFLGSIDDLLRTAIEGKSAEGVPRPGEVDFISAGSPCQGFSLLTVDKTTPQQRKNQSLVAAFATAVDFYRPKYGILENVISIIQAGDNRSEDVFSQLVCAIVGLGYQTQLAIGDAWSYGAPQTRSRVFLYFAAPGLRLPAGPLPSHSHPPDIKQRDLGKMSNGEHFVRRLFRPTAFKFVGAEEATRDLPRIDDGKPDCCIRFPDHRLTVGVTATMRQQIALIPTHPFAMNFVTTWDNGNGRMTTAEREQFPAHGKGRVMSTSKGWGRIHPKYLFQTVATACAPTDARMGRQLHWNQDRPITLMEARRAQGFLDEEVLLGSMMHKWKLVGNSVARPIALAFGLEFRKAWLGSLYDEAPILLGEVPAEQSATYTEDRAVVVPTIEQNAGQSSVSPSMSPDMEEAARAVSTTPASSVSQASGAKLGQWDAGGTRKRFLSQTDLMDSKKVRRRDSSRSEEAFGRAASRPGPVSSAPLVKRPAATAGGLTVVQLSDDDCPGREQL